VVDSGADSAARVRLGVRRGAILAGAALRCPAEGTVVERARLMAAEDSRRRRRQRGFEPHAREGVAVKRRLESAAWITVRGEKLRGGPRVVALRLRAAVTTRSRR